MDENEKALQRFAAINYINELHAQGFSLERWCTAYKHSGFNGLQVKRRNDRGQTRALDEDLMEEIASLRKQYPELTVKSLLKELYRQKVLIPGSPPRASTIYRFLRAVKLDRSSLNAGVLSGPTKAFEHALSNELWMTDAMHGIRIKTVDGQVIKTHLIALLDDCSRVVLHAEYYTRETTGCFLDVLKKAILRRGIAQKLYTDRGKIFTCTHVKQVCANFPITLLHAKPYHSWSKGKIERFFLTVQKSFEQSLVFDKVTSLEELNSRLWQWIEKDYHQQPHSALGKESPAERYRSRSHRIRVYPGQPADLERFFYKKIERRVRKDATISIDSCLWEVPTHLRGTKIEVRYDPFVTNKQLEVYLNGKCIAHATPCDKNYNAHNFKSSNYER